MKEWDPIPQSPADEYDCLIHQIISNLHKGTSEKDMASFIESELIDHFCIEEEKDVIKEVARKIFNYWENKSRNERRYSDVQSHNLGNREV